MKVSKYATIVERKNGDLLAYSGLSGVVLSVEKKKKPEFEQLLRASPDETGDRLLDFCNKRVLEAFREAKILVDDDVDEIGMLESRYRDLQFRNRGGISITITTTMKCNLTCPYCYNPIKDMVMSPELMRDVSLYVDSVLMPTLEGAEKKLLDITWIGGETLTDFNGLSRMAELLYKVAEKHNCELRSDLITNGTLLTQEILEKIVKPPFLVKAAKITLDGPKTMHDNIRRYHDGRPTFDLICEKIKLAQQYLYTFVRANVGPTFNMNSFRNLIDEMKARDISDGNLDFMFLRIHRSHNTSVEQVMPIKEFADFEFKCARYAKKLDFPMGISFPRRSDGLHCGTVQRNSVVIDAQGFISKCWCSMGNPKEAIGHVNQRMDTDGGEYRRWMDHNPFTDTDCANCVLLPGCGGGCPWLKRYFGIESCEGCIPARFNFKERLLFNYFGE